MIRLAIGELLPVDPKRLSIKIVKTIVFQDNSIAGVVRLLTKHLLHKVRRTPVVPLVIAPVCSHQGVLPDVYRALFPRSLRYPNKDHCLLLDMDWCNVPVLEEVDTHLIWVIQRIPDVLYDLLAIGQVMEENAVPCFFRAEDNITTFRIRHRRIRLPE
ncbi:hypothetical protein DSECCO2_642440 [anaerobic digester metagenome]